MSKHTTLTLGGLAVQKHWRDIAKDNVILSMVPELLQPVSGAPLRIFEASGGQAYLSRELADKGHAVTVSNYRKQGIPGVHEVEADLNAALPFADGSFDVVLCREVIEHLESEPFILREFCRVLAPGGRLILTFPNRLQVASRIFHLFSGFYRGMASPINLDVPFGEAHINLIGYPEMDYFLRKTGFTVTGADSSYFSGSDRIFAPLRLLVRFTTALAVLHRKPHAQEHDKTRPLNRAYNSFIAEVITSPALFYGKDVIIAAERLEDGAAPFTLSSSF